MFAIIVTLASLLLLTSPHSLAQVLTHELQIGFGVDNPELRLLV